MSDVTGVEDRAAKWLTKSEAAGYLRVGSRTIDRYVDQGRITRYRIGDLRTVRFDREELDALVRPATVGE